MQDTHGLAEDALEIRQESVRTPSGVRRRIDTPTRIRPSTTPGFNVEAARMSETGSAIPDGHVGWMWSGGRWTVFVSLPLGHSRPATCGSLSTGMRTRP